MQRRNFLKRGATLASMPVLGLGAPVYGMPAAAAQGVSPLPADGLLRLTLSRAGIPVELHEVFDKLASLWADLEAGGRLAALFASDPQAALRQAGLDGQIDVTDPLLDVVRASMDPLLRSMAQSLDYKGFVRELRARGLVSRVSRSALKRRFEQVIARDYQTYKEAFNHLLSVKPELAELLNRGERFNAVLAAMDPAAQSSARTNPFAAAGEAQTAPIETQAYGVRVAIAALAVIAIVVAGVVAAIVTWVIIHMQYFPPVMTPQAQRDLQRAAAVAELLGRRDLATETMRRGIDAHVSAALDAAIAMKVLAIIPARRAELYRRVREFAYEAAGV